MSRNLKELIRQMTLEEKAGLCSGADFWNTMGIERLGIPSVMMTDGPHGLRKQEGAADHLGLTVKPLDSVEDALKMLFGKEVKGEGCHAG